MIARDAELVMAAFRGLLHEEYARQRELCRQAGVLVAKVMAKLPAPPAAGDCLISSETLHELRACAQELHEQLGEALEAAEVVEVLEHGVGRLRDDVVRLAQER